MEAKHEAVMGVCSKRFQSSVVISTRRGNKGEVPFVPTFICTKMKNRFHLYQNNPTRFLIGRIVSQRIITIIFYCSNRRKLRKNNKLWAMDSEREREIERGD